MSTPFLLAFTKTIVAELVIRELLVLTGPEAKVVPFVAQRLHAPGANKSLISTLTAALISCPDVEELYADDKTLKRMITEMPRDAIHRGTP